MNTTRKGLRAAVATLGLLGSLIAVQAIPSAAQARCNGAVSETLYLTVNGTTYAEAIPVPGTCNANGLFRVNFHATQNGFRATYRWQNNGIWSAASGPYSMAWSYVEFYDANSNSLENMCVNNSIGTYICGIDGLATITASPTNTYNWNNNGF